MGAEQLSLLVSWLKEHHPQDLVIPVKADTKKPAYKHRDGQWSWAEYAKVSSTVAPGGAKHDTGVLLTTLCALDFDDDATAAEFEAEFEELRVAPMERTKTGRHYLFLRPSYADKEGFYDGARQHGAELKVDFKTRCSTGTAGLLVVAPSAGKEWVRPPWEHEPREISRALLERVCVSRKRPRKHAVSRRAAPTAATSGDPVVRLLHLLSKTRWEDRGMWRDIATALKNESGDAHLGTWLQLSKISAKYDETVARALWATVARPDYDGPRVGMGTLHAWARKDDPHGYTQYRMSVIPDVVMERWDKGDMGLADIAHALLKDKIKLCGTGTDAVMYFFDAQECRWQKGTEKSVWRMVSVALEDALRPLEMHWANMAMSQAADDNERRAYDEKKRVVAKIVDRIRNKKGMSDVTSVGAELFREDGFELRLDMHPHLLGVVNGVVDLRKGVLRERRPEDMIHTLLKVPYDPKANTEEMRNVVRAAMADDEEMVRYVQKLLGYGITGETSEELFAIFTGSGRNCKGVITQVLRDLLGDFFQAMNPGIITEQRQVSNIDAERDKLLGARIVVYDELNQGEKLKQHEVQLLSGGDGIPAKPMYKSPMTIIPRHLNILSTNHMPELTDVIPAIMERLLCIHFPVTFTDLVEGEQQSAFRRQKDPDLKRKLAENKQGTLKWLVDGAVAWYASPTLKRDAPAKVKEFSRKYFEEQDRLATFLKERCVLGEGLRESSTALLSDFNAYTSSNAVDKWLATAMKNKGFLKKKGRPTSAPRSSVMCYFGLQLKDDGPDIVDEDDDE